MPIKNNSVAVSCEYNCVETGQKVQGISWWASWAGRSGKGRQMDEE